MTPTRAKVILWVALAVALLASVAAAIGMIQTSDKDIRFIFLVGGIGVNLLCLGIILEIRNWARQGPTFPQKL